MDPKENGKPPASEPRSDDAADRDKFRDPDEPPPPESYPPIVEYDD